MTRGGRGPITSAQNSGLPSELLNDKAALKGVIWCYSISIIGCLISQTLLFQEYNVNKGFQIFIVHYQTGKLFWGKWSIPWNYFHYYIRVTESVMILKLSLCSFLNHWLGSGLGNSCSIMFLKTIPLETEQMQSESSKNHPEYALWLGGLATQGSPPTGRCQGFKRRCCSPEAALRAEGCSQCT